MRILYASKKYEKICNSKEDCKRYRADLVSGVFRRHNALKVASSIEDLKRIDPLGKWHGLTGNRNGQWSGWLNGNFRLIVEPVLSDQGVIEGEETVRVLEIEDYH